MLGSDKAQHHELVFDEPQRCEITGALVIVFQEKGIHLRPAEQYLRNWLIAAGREPG
ncbi:hypothetical protein D3C86_2243420 [compost metagenome]